MRQISRPTALAIMAVALGIATLDGEAVWRAARAGGTQGINARIVAVNIPGASAIAQIGTFVNGGTLDPSPIGKPCANPSPIPTKFPGYTGQGAVLDPNRILVGSRSNFGAPRAIGVGQEGSFLSIDPSGPGILNVPPNFASAGDQASTPGGAVQMFSANSPFWTNSQNNSGANTAKYTGVSDCRRQPDGFRNRALPSLRARVGHPDQLADALNLPVDLTPVKRDTDTANWASNTTLDDGSDFYIANQGDNTIVRMKQDGTVVAVRLVTVNGQPLDNVSLNGIAASADVSGTKPLPSTIFATFVDPSSGQGGVLAMPAF